MHAEAESCLVTLFLRAENIALSSSELANRIVGDSDFMLHLLIFLLGIFFEQGGQLRKQESWPENSWKWSGTKRLKSWETGLPALAQSKEQGNSIDLPREYQMSSRPFRQL